MNDNSPFLILQQPCGEAIHWVVRQLKSADLKVVRTFDLQGARQAQSNCPCPHHGTDQCNCQMVVLLIYGSGRNASPVRQPISMVVHGHDDQTWFSLVDTSQQRADPALISAIRRALIPRVFTPPGMVNPPHENMEQIPNSGGSCGVQ